MQTLSFKNRIAFNYILYTAILVFVVFFVVYSTVSYTIFNNVDDEIEKEIQLHVKEMKFSTDTIIWIDKEEWEEKEHNDITVNPVFVEIQDINGNTIEKSPNLKKSSFQLINTSDVKTFDETTLNNQVIQLSQTPIFFNNSKKAYLLIGMSIEHPIVLLKNLKLILVLLYPLILVLLFFIARIIAGRSIKPINNIIETSNRITKDNLKDRIALPKNKDELFALSANINNLLDRIENALEREKQFTSDASHELRTPLAIIKGTLEVLIRKPREKQEYEEKIKHCITEVDRLNVLVDELLLLARIESQRSTIQYETINLNTIVLEVLSRYSEKIKTRNLSVNAVFKSDVKILSDVNTLGIIFSNLISNALKYSNDGGDIALNLKSDDGFAIFEITNTGKGIPKEEIEKVFSPFFRSQTANISEVKGAGLGLSIVKRLCDILDIEIKIDSEADKKTTVSLYFNKKNKR